MKLVQQKPNAQMAENMICLIMNDQEIMKNVESLIDIDKNTFIIRENKINIGIIKMKKESQNIISLEIGILEQYRGNLYATNAINLLKKYIEYFYPNYKIIMKLNNKNDSHIKTALRCGFEYEKQSNEHEIYASQKIKEIGRK